jgi:Uma2 family endonuclease
MAPMVRHRFRVEEVLALASLHPEARLELLDGEVYEMTPPSSQHAGLLSARTLVSQHGVPKLGLWKGFSGAPTAANAAVGYLDWLLHALAPKVQGLAQIRVQSPLYLSPHSLPLPDLLLLRPREDFYTQDHPRPKDVLLLVEVSLSTEAWDREKKLPLYAEAGVPEVWLLTHKALQVFRRPEGRVYGESFAVARGERVAPLLLPQAELLYHPPL